MNQTFCEYIKSHYSVPADLHREVIVDKMKGVITKDMGHYIGVVFYGKRDVSAYPCHPTWNVEYLDTFNHNPPKLTRSKRKYKEYLDADSTLTFREWLGISK